MTDAAITPAAPAVTARTRLMLEGPIVPTMLGIAAPNLAVNVILIAVGIAVVTALGLVTMGGVLTGAFRLFAKLG